MTSPNSECAYSCLIFSLFFFSLLVELFDLDAKNSQTGPAIRNDDETIKKHLHLLKNSEFFELYEILSKSILKNRNEL